MERDTAPCILPAPSSCSDAFGDTERRQSQTLEEPPGHRLLAGPQAPPDLLDGKGTDPRFGTEPPKTGESGGCLPAPKGIDEDGRIKEEAGHASARPAVVTPALRAHPASRVVVPLVAPIRQLPQGSLDVVPAALVLETAADQLGDERTPAPGTHTPIQLGDQIVLQRYVQTHVPRFAHKRVGRQGVEP